MSYQLRNNRCEGWWQGVFCDSSGTITESARFSNQAEAVEAIHHHHRKGLWPREVEVKDVEICSSCGQPLPIGG